MKRNLIMLGILIGWALSLRAQISGPSTVGAGQAATWTNNAAAANSYTWSPQPTSQPAAASLTATSVSSAKFGANMTMDNADYPSIWNDNGHWYAFTISYGVDPNAGATLYRLDLGSDPTPSNNNASNTVTVFNLATLGLSGSNGELVHSVAFDPVAKTWHLFWFNTGVAGSTLKIKRLDFGTSLANTPGTATDVQVQSSVAFGIQAAQSKFVRASNGDFIWFLGNRWGGPVRVNFGQNITNTAPVIDWLPGTITAGTGIGSNIGRSSALDVVRQDGKWYLFCSTTDGGNNLWRIDFGSDLAGTPTAVTGLGTFPFDLSFGLQVVPSHCGDEYYGFILAGGSIYRLNFGNDLTSVPSSQQIGTGGQKGLPGMAGNSGLFAYTCKDSLYAVMGGWHGHGIYSLRLPYSYNGNMPVHKTPDDNTFTHTYNTVGTYELTTVLNLNGGGASVYCYTVNVVQPRPAQPGPFTAAPSSVCRGQGSVTYRVPAVSGATAYHWYYTGSNVTYSSATSDTFNSLTFSGTATSGLLRVWAVKGSDSSALSRDSAITVNALPSITISPATAAVCAGQSVTLTASGATTYSWSHSGGSNAAATYTPATTTTYTVTGTSLGCSATGTRQVTVNVLPVTQVTAGGATDICAGDSVVLTASGSGYTYVWKDGSGAVAGNGQQYKAHATGSYRVIATDAGSGCKDSTQPVSVTVHSRPQVSLTPGDTAFCEGGMVQLSVSTADTGLTYRWKNGTATIPLATADFLEVSETGIYMVVAGRAQVAACEDSTNEVQVTVHPLPVADVAWDGLLLHAVPGYASYQWLTGTQPVPGATDSTFQPLSDGGYAVTVTDSNGCSNTSQVYNLTVGVDDITALAAQVRVYPNPAREMIYIETPVAVHVYITSLEGRMLFKRGNVSGKLDIGAVPPGLYLLTVTDLNGTHLRTEKLLKVE